jgi:accessory colonization factor AcfC
LRRSGVLEQEAVMRTLLSVLLGIALVFANSASHARAQDLRVYGPGGPAPAIREAAMQFAAAHGIKISVTAGPTGKWIDAAKSDADLIYSGSETMMTDFIDAMGGELVASTVTPLYLRVSAILVRPGNPKHIKGFSDLLAPGIKILIVNGAGQNGLWEDIAGRQGNMQTVKALRANIVNYAKTSADARQAWVDDRSIDVWLTWTIWQGDDPGLAEVVAVEPELRIYRDAGIALTQRGRTKASAKDFVMFLASPAGASIFQKWGWIIQ